MEYCRWHRQGELELLDMVEKECEVPLKNNDQCDSNKSCACESVLQNNNLE